MVRGSCIGAMVRLVPWRAGEAEMGAGPLGVRTSMKAAIGST